MKIEEGFDSIIQFGLRLPGLRLKTIRSQEAFDDLAELARPYISRCQCGRKNLSIQVLYKINTALKIPALLLLYVSDKGSDLNLEDTV